MDLVAKRNGPRVKSKCSNNSRVILNEFFISKLCGLVETKLRLDVHENLQLLQTENLDPFETCNPSHMNRISISGMYRLLGLKIIPFLHETTVNFGIKEKNYYLSIRDHVIRYLSQMFYNLTTITMHDWRTYGQMRVFSKYKFHLETVEDHLPNQTLEQGLDALEIMRNIHLFVSNYVYNLNNQMFIEKNSKNKHLNTINIRHIANSLRTHGIGIINTTVINIHSTCLTSYDVFVSFFIMQVNFTYQFLHKKFYMFSQFLYNEHIQSRLMKDYKSFQEACLDGSENKPMYSYERANSLNKNIRQLGFSKNGFNSLDLFRQLITHIGRINSVRLSDFLNSTVIIHSGTKVSRHW